MPLTPLDVENLRLRGALRGYDRADVDHFRSAVVDTIEDYVDQLARLKMRVRELESELARFREQEDTLKSSVMLAQRTADELVAAARERAGAVLEQAKVEAEQVRRGVADVLAQREQFEYQFHGLLSGFLRRLESSNPALAGIAPKRNAGSAPAVLQGMDTARTPEQPEEEDLQIDMEDLTVEPASEVNREDDGEETVILPMAQPGGGQQPPEYARRIDRDNIEFSAALESAGSRPEVLAESQRPVSGSAVHESAEDVNENAGEEATKSLTEIADERLRREHPGDDRPLDYP